MSARRLIHRCSLASPVRPTGNLRYQYAAHNLVRGNATDSYEQITAMRIKVPYIEAVKQKKDQGAGSGASASKPSTPASRDLSPKRMSDSYSSLVLPLAEDPWLLDKYINANGDIRLGTILMDLDAFSGVVAHKHVGDRTMTVTAAVDRIIIQHPLKEICNLEMSGQVTFATGRSSVEVSLQVAKAPKPGLQVKPEDVLVTCAFTMVSLDPSTKKPINVPPLKIETDEERRLFELGELNYNAKKGIAKTSLRKTVPNNEESSLVHGMWMKQLDYNDSSVVTHKPNNVVYMDNTRVHSTQIMQPEFRNRHNFMIFGGYLMQQTFELAFTCAAAFSHSRPVFLSLDPSTFENPVPVGSVLYLTATVAYTEDTVDGYTRTQVRVDSRVRDVEHGEKKPTGQFNYTFLIKKDIKIMPRTYQEFMIWIDARRRAHRMHAAFGDNGSKTKIGGDDGKTDRKTE